MPGMALPVVTCYSIWMYWVSQPDPAAKGKHNRILCHTKLVIDYLHLQLVGFGDGEMCTHLFSLWTTFRNTKACVYALLAPRRTSLSEFESS
jgi:hypothetical protein